jgi:uncharacterized protein YjbJ (UPF0337 family)
MQKNRIEGIGHQIKGVIKESLGKLIGDSKLQHDGAGEREGGEAQSAVDPGPVQVAGIDSDRLVGIGHQLKGALAEGVGSVIGNPTLEASGRAERAAGKVQNAAGGARDEARDALAEAGTADGIEKDRDVLKQPS